MFYNIIDGKDTMVFHYNDSNEVVGQTFTVKPPCGNRSVDGIVAFLNNGRLDEYVAS
jgi:hypothetical protein